MDAGEAAAALPPAAASPAAAAVSPAANLASAPPPAAEASPAAATEAASSKGLSSPVASPHAALPPPPLPSASPPAPAAPSAPPVPAVTAPAAPPARAAALPTPASAAGPAAAAPPAPVAWPADGRVTPGWVASLCASLEGASQLPARALPSVLPAAVLSRLLSAALEALSADDTLVQVAPPAGARVTVVGDTHGQLHDLLRLFDVAGTPGADRLFVFNGDYVDRGAWGVELLAIVLAWKLAAPGAVTVLRGNHETLYATCNYGFKSELGAKYGPRPAAALFKQFARLFALLPLGARVGRCFVCHGGLFRGPPPPGTRGSAAVRAAADEAAATLPLSRLGTLEDLRRAHRGGQDPNGVGTSQTAADVTWSDPDAADGLSFNSARGIGLVYGPDATAHFLRTNGLTLVIRSHEGPDAREQRPSMASMASGWCVDHDTPAGRLATLFSAPDYPQFSAPDEPRAGNRAAVAVLRGPHFDEPEVTHFDAAPRPAHAVPYYDLAAPGSDEEGPDGDARSDVSE